MSWPGVDEEDMKPVIKPGVHVTLKVQDTDGRAVYRTMRRTEKLQGLMDFYYASVAPAVEHGTGRFLYDGGRLRGWQTPAGLGMTEDGDEVDFFTELLGGGGPCPRPLVASVLSRHHLPKAEQDTAAVRPLFVTLKVVDQEQRLIRHTIRMTDKLQAVMDAYYDKVPDVAYDTGSFWFDSVRLRGERTPAELKLEDGDVIDFFETQVGGGSDAGSVSA